MQTRGLSEMTMEEIDAEIALVGRLDGRRHDDVSQATMPEVALSRFCRAQDPVVFTDHVERDDADSTAVRRARCRLPQLSPSLP